MVLFFSIEVSFSQMDSIKNGAYRNFMELQKKTPFLVCKFEIDNIYPRDSVNLKPDIFRITPKNHPVKLKTMKMEVWLIADSNRLFINCNRMEMGRDFLEIKYSGRYSYFLGLNVITSAQKRDIANSAILFGVVGGAIAVTDAKFQNAGKIHYVMDFKTGSVRLLDSKYMSWVLKDEMELLSQYNVEQEPSSIEILLKYLKMLNEKLKQN